MAEHQWGEPDEEGIRRCVRHGCGIGLLKEGRSMAWHEGPDGQHGWMTVTKKNPIPACKGAAERPPSSRVPVLHIAHPDGGCTCGADHDPRQAAPGRMTDERLSEWNNQAPEEVMRECRRARSSEQELLADNAALLKVLRSAAGDATTADACLWCGNVPPIHKDRCRFDLTLEDQHPGTALLTRMEEQRTALSGALSALRNLRVVGVSQGVSEQHGVIINADAAIAAIEALS